MSAHWAPFLTSQDRAKGPQCILACNLPWFHCLAWGLGCALIPVWTLVVLTRDRCITQRTSVGEEGLSLQYSTYFVSLYRSRDILFLAVVARCLFWPSLLTIFQQLPLYHVRVECNWQSFFRNCMYFSVAAEFFHSRKMKRHERNWKSYNDFFRRMFCLCILKISLFPLTFYMHAN